MTALFQNKYRVPSARKPDWDYGADAAYFITICVHNRLHAFGEIVKDELIPTILGQIADAHWLKIPEQFPDASLDAHVIMPNHMHGILILQKSSLGLRSQGSFPKAGDGPVDKHKPPLKVGGITGEMNPMLQENVSRIVRRFKGRCAYEMHTIDPSFQWQARFHDRIIRDDAEYERIRNYILNNPVNWKNDEFHGG